MQNPVGKNVAMAVTPATRATELFPRVVSNALVAREEEKQMETQENNGHMNLPITDDTGETQANLCEVITHYVETLNQYNLRNLGRLSMFLLYSHV